MTNVIANKKLVGDIDQLFYITCTLEVRSYVNSTSMEATNQLPRGSASITFLFLFFFH